MKKFDLFHKNGLWKTASKNLSTHKMNAKNLFETGKSCLWCDLGRASYFLHLLRAKSFSSFPSALIFLVLFVSRQKVQ